VVVVAVQSQYRFEIVLPLHSFYSFLSPIESGYPPDRSLHFGRLIPVVAHPAPRGSLGVVLCADGCVCRRAGSLLGVCVCVCGWVGVYSRVIPVVTPWPAAHYFLFHYIHHSAVWQGTAPNESVVRMERGCGHTPAA
jgi:hypothetical protein